LDYISILINLVIAIIVAVLTALITSKLSLKGFYRQEIWLRKETQYNQIIDSLNKIQRYYWHIIYDDTRYNESDEYRKESEIISDEYDTAKRELEMLSSTPLFMVKSEVMGILEEMLKSANTKTEQERMGDWFSYFDRLGFEAKNAKNKIAEIAYKDLEIPDPSKRE
jgi:hypothetical protein